MTKRRTARALRERKAAPTACAARFAPRRAQTSPFAGKPNQTQAPQPPINRMNKFALPPHHRALTSNPTLCSGMAVSLSLRVAFSPKETSGALAFAAGVSRHPRL